jgi:hypothetical protein
LADATPWPVEPAPLVLTTSTPDASKHRFSVEKRPELEIRLASEASSPEDVVLQAKLKASGLFEIPLTERGRPEITVSFRTGEKNWSFSPLPKASPMSKTVNDGDNLEWEIRVSELQKPEKYQELVSLFQREPTVIAVVILEDDPNPNMMSRRVLRHVSGEVEHLPGSR